MPLMCAKGIEGFKEAEMHLNVEGRHVVSVRFLGIRPSKSSADRAMRDCLDRATHKDTKKDIVANAWYRKSKNDSPARDELLQPYGAKTSLVYNASLKRMELRTKR